jgi:hypothetical protein
MALVEKGDLLNTGLGVLQPGWTVENDGYGLLTCRAEYIKDSAVTYPIPASAIRNVAFSGDTRLSGHKFSVQRISLRRLKITVDYVGIDSSQPYAIEGFTRPNVTGNNGLSTEKIETHPNFFTNSVGIAGPGPYTESDKGPIVVRKKDEWVTDSNGTINMNGKSFIGYNGACFERADGGRFIGFVDKAYPKFYGKSSYLAPTTVWSGVVYTDSSSDVNLFASLVGKASNNNNLGTGISYDFLPSNYGGPTWTSESGDPQLLLSKADGEEFGPIYKISYEIRYSKEGFPLSVYG